MPGASTRPAMVLGYLVEEVVMTHLLPAFFFPIFGFGFVMYFLPSIIALARSKRDIAAIVLLNFFLGWTMIGWVVALVWAVKADVPMVVR